MPRIKLDLGVNFSYFCGIRHIIKEVLYETHPIWKSANIENQDARRKKLERIGKSLKGDIKTDANSKTVKLMIPESMVSVKPPRG